jgi:hypothetical protein
MKKYLDAIAKLSADLKDDKSIRGGGDVHLAAAQAHLREAWARLVDHEAVLLQAAGDTKPAPPAPAA